MKRKPWPIIVIAVLHFLAPLWNLLFHSYTSNVSLAQKMQLYFASNNLHFLLFYWLVPVIAGYGIWVCRRWGFYLYLICMATLLVFSSVIYAVKQPPYGLLQLVVSVIIDVLVVTYFLVPAVRQVYFDPRLRWWETALRYRTSIKANCKFEDSVIDGDITNFSESGLFFKSTRVPGDGAEIRIGFDFKGTDYALTGTVVQHQRQSAVGFGVRFLVNEENKRTVKLLTPMFSAEGWAMTERLPGMEDGFKSWVHELIRSGRGFFPQVKK